MTGSYRQYRGYNRSQGPDDLPKQVVNEQFDNYLSLTVLFTTVRGTLDALHGAAHFSHDLEARLQILVPYVIPYPLPIDKEKFDPKSRLGEFITMCEQQPIETRIDIWLCRDVCQCIHDGLRPNSLVVIGGRRSWWPLAYEKRLTRSVQAAGHQVVFIAH